MASPAGNIAIGSALAIGLAALGGRVLAGVRSRVLAGDLGEELLLARLRLDDFRVAASSLSTFEKLPFDEIKIHASALRRAQKDPVSMTVLAAVTGLAHNLGMSVCAEGVEDQATFEFLKTIECDKMQGFLISEAVLPNIIRRVYSAKRTDTAA